MKLYKSLIVTPLLLLTFCKPASDDSSALIDSLNSVNSKYQVVAEIRIVGYDPNHFSMMISAALEGDSTHNNSHVKLWVNRQEMKYTTATGNYYERSAAFRTEFDEKNGLPDSLFFEIVLADTSTVKAPALSMKSFRDFLKSEDLYKDIDAVRTKPVMINWGGKLPDALSVMRTVTISLETGESIEPELITHQEWSETNPYEITSDYFASAAGSVQGFEVKWYKSEVQTAASPQVRCFVSIDAAVSQSITLK